jgi:hypothetical protein
MSTAAFTRGLCAPSRSAARVLMSRASVPVRSLPLRTASRSLSSVQRSVPLRAAADGATSLVRRALLGGLLVTGLSHSGSRNMVAAAGGSIPAPEDVAAPPADAQVTASGLASKVLKPGSGARACAQRRLCRRVRLFIRAIWHLAASLRASCRCRHRRRATHAQCDPPRRGTAQLRAAAAVLSWLTNRRPNPHRRAAGSGNPGPADKVTVDYTVSMPTRLFTACAGARARSHG